MLRMWRRSSTSDYETEKLRKTPPSRSIPRGLKWRSSRPFIVGVISFAIFTVRFLLVRGD